MKLDGPIQSRDVAAEVARAYIAANALGWIVEGADVVCDGDRMLQLADRPRECVPGNLTFEELNRLPRRPRDRDDLRLPSIYGATIAGAWVVYVRDGTPTGIRCSTIIVIDKATGLVRYAGGANDEG